MYNLDPRIQTALVSVNPTTRNPAWHGCPTTSGVLRGVSASVAVWRPYPGANNIREIALHIASCENSVANQLIGKTHRAGFNQRKTGWAVMLEAIEEAQWEAEVALVKVIHERLTEAVTRCDPGRLDQPAGKATKRSAAETIHGVAEHSLYHTAQMEMIKTLAKQLGMK